DPPRAGRAARRLRRPRGRDRAAAGVPASRGRHCRGGAGHRGRPSGQGGARMCRRDNPGDKRVKTSNTQCRLAARPTGLVKATDFTIAEEPVPTAADGQLVVGIDYLSIDPAMRTWMNAGRSYVPPVEIGEVMRALGIGRVVESRHPGFAVGDVV